MPVDYELLDGACPFLIMQYPQAMQIVRNTQAVWWESIDSSQQEADVLQSLNKMHMLKGVSYPPPRFVVRVRCQVASIDVNPLAMLVASFHSKELAIELFKKTNDMVTHGMYFHYCGRLKDPANAAVTTWQSTIDRYKINITDFLRRDQEQYRLCDTAPHLRQIELEQTK